MSAWPGGIAADLAAQVERRVTAGERVSVVGIEFGLLDTEVREIVKRVRAARAARTSATSQPRPSAEPPSPAAGAPQTPAGVGAPGRSEHAGSEPLTNTPAGPTSPTASRIGRLLTTGSPVGTASTIPAPASYDVSKYLDHPDKRIAKAAAAAHKALGVLGGLVFAWEAAENDRQEQARARTEAAEAVDKLEQQLAEAREKLRAAGGVAAAKPPTGQSKAVRAWAAEKGVPCPPVGRVPRNVQEAYDQAHAEEAHA